MSKFLTLNGSRMVIDHVVAAMRIYAQAAYPKGGSECSQSAREALMSAADAVDASFDMASSAAQLNRRQRVLTRSAIQYYTQQLAQEEAGAGEAREACLLSLLAGDRVDDAMYDDAEQQDRRQDT